MLIRVLLAAWTKQETRNGSRDELGLRLRVTVLITLSASFQENSISYSKADHFLVASDECVRNVIKQATTDFHRKSHIKSHRVRES